MVIVDGIEIGVFIQRREVVSRLKLLVGRWNQFLHYGNGIMTYLLAITSFINQLLNPPQKKLSPNMQKRHNRAMKRVNKRGDRYNGRWAKLYHYFDKIHSLQGLVNHRNLNKLSKKERAKYGL